MRSTTAVAPETPGRGPEDAADGTTRPATAASPSQPAPEPAGSELAALEAARDEKRQLLEVAARRLPAGQELPAGCTKDGLSGLLQRYYWSEPAAEVVGHDPADLAALALGHLRLAEVRPQGSATVDVSRVPDGRAVLRIVTDDMPFLVDSDTAEVVRQGAGLQHVVHPVVVVRRDVTGRIRAFCDAGSAEGCGPDALAESWMAVVLDGPVDEEAAGDLVAGLRTVLAGARGVDEDAGRMRDRALELADRLERAAPAGPAADPAPEPAD